MNISLAMLVVVGTLFQDCTLTRLTVRNPSDKTISHTVFSPTVTYGEAVSQLKGFAVTAYAVSGRPIPGKGWPVKIKGRLDGKINVRLVLLSEKQPILPLERADWEKLSVWLLAQGKELPPVMMIETNRLAWNDGLVYQGRDILFFPTFKAR